MMRGVIEEARQIVLEMPAFAAAFLLLMAMCIGVRCTVFNEADGEQLRLVAHQDRHVEGGMSFGDPVQRMRLRAECSAKVPGFTVILGLRQYNMELSVPVKGVQVLFRNTPRERSSMFEVLGTA